MKMARASDEDMDAAFKVCQILDQLDKRYMPSDDDSEELEFFDRDDAEQCQKIVGMLLDATSSTSLFRVVFGMAVVLDPRNELLDPDADTIEMHPKIIEASKNSRRWNWMLANHRDDMFAELMASEWADEIDKRIAAEKEEQC